MQLSSTSGIQSWGPSRLVWRGLASLFLDAPSLDSIREEPEFKAIIADIERDMARQRAELAKRPKDTPLDLGSSR